MASTEMDAIEFGSEIPEVACVYVVRDADFKPLYIGQTNNLRRRFLAHHRNPQFKALGATQIGWWLCEDDQERLDQEEYLISELKPSLNGGPTGREGKTFTFLVDQRTREQLDTLLGLLPLDQTSIIRLAIHELAEKKKREGE